MRLLLASLAGLGTLGGVHASAGTAAPRFLTEEIGRSHEGRPIVATRLGALTVRRNVLVVGCIHGNECAAAPVLARLRTRTPPQGVALWIIPTLNPDGRAARTRGNARGVDLNRNFPAMWRRIPRPSRYYSGPRPSSEPETRAVMGFLASLRPALSIWFHQPEVNIRDPDASAQARQYARLVGLPFLPLASPPGTSVRWHKRTDPRARSFAVELPAGPLSAASAARHARAVRLVAHTAAPSTAVDAFFSESSVGRVPIGLAAPG